MSVKHSVSLVTAVALLGFCGLACSSEDDGRVDLRLRLVPGESYGLQFTVEQRRAQSIEGQQREKQEVISFDFVVEPTSVDDSGVADVLIRVAAVRFQELAPQGLRSFDSSNPPERLPIKPMALKTMVDRELRARLSPTGSVSEIQGLDEMFAAMLEPLKPWESPLKPLFIASLHEQFGPEAIRQIIESIVAPYSGQPIAVGDWWTHNIVQDVGCAVRVEKVFGLAELREGAGVIAVQSRIRSNPEDRIQQGSRTLAYDLTGEEAGTLEVDLRTGWIIRGELRQLLTGSVNVWDSPESEPVSRPLFIESLTRLAPVGTPFPTSQPAGI